MTGCPETAIWNYHCTVGNIPIERRSQYYVLEFYYKWV